MKLDEIWICKEDVRNGDFCFDKGKEYKVIFHFHELWVVLHEEGEVLFSTSSLHEFFQKKESSTYGETGFIH